jgi:hypothetical protein
MDAHTCEGADGHSDPYLPMGNLLYAYAAMRALAGLFVSIMRRKAREKFCVAEMTCNFFWGVFMMLGSATAYGSLDG